MPGNKTRKTDASVQAHIASRAKGQQLADCQELLSLLAAAVQEPPRMWGPSIIGFGAYRYRYESGRTGEAPLAAFAIRGRELVVYLDCEESAQQALLSRLGKHKTGKSCLYFKELADLDRSVLRQLVDNSIAGARARHDPSRSPQSPPGDRHA